MSSDVPDHCRVYALKDPTDRNYQSQCSHEHRQTHCDKYDNFTKTIDDITAAIEALAADELKEELRFVMGRAKQDIVSWIALLLRSVNKKKARLDIVNALNDTSVLLVQDWAMKFLPRKFRESQTDWFARGGISCHLTLSTRGGNDLKPQTMTFNNAFRSCSQESCIVISVMYGTRGDTT